MGNKRISLFLKNKIEDYFETLYAQKYEMKFRLYFSDVKPKMAIFVSKLSHCLFDMLARYTAGEWNVEIPLIISNHPDLQHVQNVSVYRSISSLLLKRTKRNRKKQKWSCWKNITSISLYWHAICKWFPNKWLKHIPNRIINIHHSFLPCVRWCKTLSCSVWTRSKNHWCDQPLCYLRTGCRSYHWARCSTHHTQGHCAGFSK